MPFIPSNALTMEQSDAYMMMYYATVKLLADAIVRFDSLSKSSPDPVQRNLYQLKAMDANRSLDLLSSRMHVFLEGTSAIRPPSAAEIAKAQGLAHDLAVLIAQQASTEAITKLVTDGVAAFISINEGQ